MKEKILLHVNGSQYHIEADPQTPLLYVLRNQLGLWGVKTACGQEQCGACNVLIDGEAVPSCKLHVGAVQGSQIITIEGLGTPDALHPLQEVALSLRSLRYRPSASRQRACKQEYDDSNGQ